MGDEDVQERPAEREKVADWRLKTLLDAGYPLPIAERIASRPHVDLHRAVELVQASCPPETAARILL